MEYSNQTGAEEKQLDETILMNFYLFCWVFFKDVSPFPK